MIAVGKMLFTVCVEAKSIGLGNFAAIPALKLACGDSGKNQLNRKTFYTKKKNSET